MNVKMIILLIELVDFSPRLVICKYLNTMILDHLNEKIQFKEEEKNVLFNVQKLKTIN